MSWEWMLDIVAKIGGVLGGVHAVLEIIKKILLSGLHINYLTHLTQPQTLVTIGSQHLALDLREHREVF